MRWMQCERCLSRIALASLVAQCAFHAKISTKSAITHVLGRNLKKWQIIIFSLAMRHILIKNQLLALSL